jgi:hypothetical protein
MKEGMLFSIILGVAIGAAPVRAESIPLKPGEYQITAVTETSNGEAGKPDSHTRCMKEEHLAHPDAIFNYYKLNGFKPKPSNKVTNVSIHDGKVSYDIEGPHAMTHVEGTVSGTSFSVLRKATPMDGNGVLVTMRVEGKRTGDCPSK